MAPKGPLTPIRSRQLRMETSRPSKLGIEHNPWFWNPSLHGVKFAPEDFRAKLHAIDPDLEACWNPITEKWQMFFRKPSVRHEICRGWTMIFVVHDGLGNYVPLDERTLAKVYEVSGRQWGSAARYLDAVLREQDRDRSKREAADHDEVNYKAGEFFNHTQPRVGYGPISESKVVGQ